MSRRWDGGHLLAPELVGEADEREPQVLLAEPQLREKSLGVAAEVVPGEGLGLVQWANVFAGGLADAVAQRPRFRDHLERGGGGLFGLRLRRRGRRGFGVEQGRHGGILGSRAEVTLHGRDRRKRL
jgi:hypothetical protein